MAILTVVEYPHKALRTPATPVTVFDEALKQLVADMIETMYHGRGVGLAANQVAILSRILVIDISDDEDSPLCFINPEIIAAEGEDYFAEGCLSMPGIYPKIKRAIKVTVKYQNEFGHSKELTCDGLMAQCLQHETDHLDGILSIDRLSSLKRALLLKRIEKNQRRAG